MSAGVSPAVNRIKELAQEIKLAAVGWDEPRMATVIADMNALPEALEDLAAAFGALATKAEEFPMAPLVKEQLHSIRGRIMGAAAAFTEIGPSIAAIHAQKIEDMQNPQHAMWDVDRNAEVM